MFGVPYFRRLDQLPTKRCGSMVDQRVISSPALQGRESPLLNLRYETANGSSSKTSATVVQLPELSGEGFVGAADYTGLPQFREPVGLSRGKYARAAATREKRGRKRPPACQRDLRRDFLPLAVGNSTFGQIVGRKFDANAVAGNNTYEVLAHPASYVCGDKVSTFDFHTKPRIRQGLSHGALHFKGFFFLLRHIRLCPPGFSRGLRRVMGRIGPGDHLLRLARALKLQSLILSLLGRWSPAD